MTAFLLAIESDIPTLLLSGELDPATPPDWGTLAMEKMTNAKHFVAPYATHGVATQSCGNDLVAELIDQGSLNDLDDAVSAKTIPEVFILMPVLRKHYPMMPLKRIHHDFSL